MTLDTSLARPAFLGIGVQRAATTWVYECLRAHPDVFLPDHKELHYFDENYELGASWYASHFPDSVCERTLGEITPSYLHIDGVAERIANDLPDIKLFVILREPISRARSGFELFRDDFGRDSFTEACTLGSSLVQRSLYSQPLEQYFSLFKRKQILVLLFDDVMSHPQDSLEKICNHIDVRMIEPDKIVGRGTNSVVFPHTQRLLNRIGLDALVNLAKQEPFNRLIRDGASKIRDRQRKPSNGPSEEVRAQFRLDTIKVQSLIDRDLSRWLSILE